MFSLCWFLGSSLCLLCVYFSCFDFRYFILVLYFCEVNGYTRCFDFFLIYSHNRHDDFFIRYKIFDFAFFAWIEQCACGADC